MSASRGQAYLYVFLGDGDRPAPLPAPLWVTPPPRVAGSGRVWVLEPTGPNGLATGGGHGGGGGAPGVGVGGCFIVVRRVPRWGRRWS